MRTTGEGIVEIMMLKKLLLLTVVLSLAVYADTLAITDVTAQQRYPWNGLVDITCKVTGIDGMTNGLKFAMEAVNRDSGSASKALHFWVVRDGVKDPNAGKD